MSLTFASRGNKSSGRVVVLGVGNELLRDEGVGVHVARALAGESLPDLVEVIESGTALECLPGDGPISKLVIVDAALGGGEPGTIYRFTREDVASGAVHLDSLHHFGLLHSLALSEMVGIKPSETVIIGVEPKEIGWGIELSAEIQSCIPQVVRVVLEVVEDIPGGARGTNH